MRLTFALGTLAVHGPGGGPRTGPPGVRAAMPPLVLAVAAGCGGEDAGRGNADAMAAGPADAQEAPVNRLAPEEEEAGWVLLSDGTLDAWRGYRREDVPAGWSAAENAIAFAPGVEGGSIITRDQFTDFELAFEWRVEERGNSGVFYKVTEADRAPYWTGPEYQILDNAGHPDGRRPETSAGANYALHAPARDATRPVGDWNEGRIVVRGPRVEHWLNGAKIVEYELWTDEWRALVAETKFGEWPGYGMAEEGHLGLQDHGDPVWYRNVRIREL